MSQTLIDTHSHLYVDQFDDDIEAVIERAKANKVHRIYLPNIDQESVHRVKSLHRKDPNLFHMMVGLHPTDVNAASPGNLNWIEEELNSKKYVAVGEIGIDLYWDKTFLKEQTEVFEAQVQMAIDHKLPFVIHARDSFDEIFSSLKKFNPSDLRGIFHSFTGTIEQAETALSLGDFKLGINGIVTFKNSGLDATVKKIGLEHLVLETDAPYLAPVPHRGKRNESSYLLLIAEKIADIFAVSLDEVTKVTHDNARYIFKD